MMVGPVIGIPIHGALADRLMEEVLEFTKGAPLQDDRTLVVMKVL